MILEQQLLDALLAFSRQREEEVLQYQAGLSDLKKMHANLLAMFKSVSEEKNDEKGDGNYQATDLAAKSIRKTS